MTRQPTNSGEPSTPKLPRYYAVPGGTPTKRCSCARRIWFVDDGGKKIPVTCDVDYITLKSGERLLVPGVTPPTSTASGMGFNHHIDCPDSKQHQKSPAPAQPHAAPAPAPTSEKTAKPRNDASQNPNATDEQKAIARAEAWAEHYGIRCTGSPFVPEQCGGFAVIALLISDKLFATPCSACADNVVRAIKTAGRFRDMRAGALDRYLVGSTAEKFADKARRIRAQNRDKGFAVPKYGPLL